ncbi:DUF2339 domain-containing protein, partial [bacterium]|nr:DUF2339 domain-containing protein [bacterium]
MTARIAAIEAHLGLTAATASSTPLPAPGAPELAVDVPASPPGLQLPAVGSSLLMLAGAFLLRAVTDAGMLSSVVGVSLGLAYILVLLYLTDRDARRGQRMRANLFGAATVLVAYPFIWETTTKLDLLPAMGSAAVTVLITTLALGVALRHRLEAPAWIVLLAAVVVCSGLYWTTDTTLLFLAVLVALGVATVWLAYLRDWRGPQWLVAIVVNVLVFLTVILAAHPVEQATGRPTPAPGGALSLALALPVVYLASFSWRTLVQRRGAGVFEILQSLGCIMAGYVGAIHLLRAAGRSTAALGWATLIAAVAGYAVAFILVRGRQGRGLNFFYYAWLGLVLTFIGTALVVSGPWLPYLWAGLGVAAAITGGIFDRWTLRLHCASYLIGAAVVAGLANRIFEAFVARRTPTWVDPTVAGPIVWILAAVCYTLLVAAQRGRAVPGWRRVPRFLVATLALIGAGILCVTALSVWSIGAVPGPAGAIVSVVRTAVLSAVTVLLAALGRRPLLVELSWFVNPLLVLIGLKVLLEDLRRGTPVSLFFGFACFGIALIVAPRLRLRRADAGPEPSPEP